MAKLSLSRAWDETREVMAHDGKLIGAVGLALFFLPGVIVGFLDPGSDELPATGGDVLVMALVAVVGIIGQLALIRLALGSHGTVGEAIGHGARRALPYIAASLLWLCPFLIAGYFLAGDLFRHPQSAPPSAALSGLVILIALIIISVRMLMTSSVATAEAASPIDIIRRSWAMTSGHWWRLFGFLVAFLVVAIVSLSAVGALVGVLVGLALGPAEPMSVSALLTAVVVELVTTVITVVFLVMLARLYVQLSAPRTVSVPSSGT